MINLYLYFSSPSRLRQTNLFYSSNLIFCLYSSSPLYLHKHLNFILIWTFFHIFRTIPPQWALSHILQTEVGLSLNIPSLSFFFPSWSNLYRIVYHHCSIFLTYSLSIPLLADFCETSENVLAKITNDDLIAKSNIGRVEDGLEQISEILRSILPEKSNEGFNRDAVGMKRQDR